MWLSWSFNFLWLNHYYCSMNPSQVFIYTRLIFYNSFISISITSSTHLRSHLQFVRPQSTQHFLLGRRLLLFHNNYLYYFILLQTSYPFLSIRFNIDTTFLSIATTSNIAFLIIVRIKVPNIINPYYQSCHQLYILLPLTQLLLTIFCCLLLTSSLWSYYSILFTIVYY